MSLASLLKNQLKESSQHFQVACQVLKFSPRNVKRLFETGFALYRGTKEAKHPVFLHIEPTGACNLKCTMCPRTESITRNLQHMKYDKFTKICDAVNPVFIAFVGFGEPFVNPQLLDMVRYAIKKGITTRISTNATLLNTKRSTQIIESGLDQIWFSIDSPTAENFEKIRVGADFNKVLEGIQEFMAIRKERKSNIVVTANFTITQENIHEVPKMVTFAHEQLHITPTFARGYGYDIEAQQQRAIQNTPEIQKYLSEALELAQKYNMEEVVTNLKTVITDLKHPLDGRGPCYFPYYVVAISWDGRVSPCCLFYDYQMELGNVNDKPFEEIWNGAAYQNFRMKLKTKRQDIKICNTCSLNDISIHNMMHKISKIPGPSLLTKEKYNYIDRMNFQDN